MASLEELNVNLDDVSFEPITNVVFIMKNGAQIGVGTPLTVSAFTEIWNARKRKLKVITGKDSYAYINKRRVDFYHVFPVTK